MAPRRKLSRWVRSTLRLGWDEMQRHRQQVELKACFSVLPAHLTNFTLRMAWQIGYGNGPWRLFYLMFNKESSLEQRKEKLWRKEAKTLLLWHAFSTNASDGRKISAARKMLAHSRTCTTHACHSWRCGRTMSGVGGAALPSPRRCTPRCYKRFFFLIFFLRCRLAGALVTQALLRYVRGLPKGITTEIMRLVEMNALDFCGRSLCSSAGSIITRLQWGGTAHG